MWINHKFNLCKIVWQSSIYNIKQNCTWVLCFIVSYLILFMPRFLSKKFLFGNFHDFCGCQLCHLKIFIRRKISLVTSTVPRISNWSKQNKENDIKEIRKYSTHFVLTSQTSKQQTLQDKFKKITCNFEYMEVKYGVWILSNWMFQSSSSQSVVPKPAVQHHLWVQGPLWVLLATLQWPNGAPKYENHRSRLLTIFSSWKRRIFESYPNYKSEAQSFF